MGRKVLPLCWACSAFLLLLAKEPPRPAVPPPRPVNTTYTIVFGAGGSPPCDLDLLSLDPAPGGNDESDFPELQTAREYSEEEEEASVEWGTPRELTFSYITIAGGPSSSPPLGDHGPRGRRDSQTRRAWVPLPHTETCETFVPALGDSLENIPSLCPSPEDEGSPPPGHCQGLDTFSIWDARLGCASEPDTAEDEGAHVSPPHSTDSEALDGEQCSSESSSGTKGAAGTPEAGRDGRGQCKGHLLVHCQLPEAESEGLLLVLKPLF